MPDPNAGDSGPIERQLTKRSTRAADRASFEIEGSWPPPGYRCRWAISAAMNRKSVVRSMRCGRSILACAAPLQAIVAERREPSGDAASGTRCGRSPSGGGHGVG